MTENFCNDLLMVFNNYIEKSKVIINTKEQPEKNSQAKYELQNETYKDHVASAIAMGVVLREVAADNLMGIQRVLTEPIMTFAPFVLYRNLIEMSAMSIWFLSTGIHEVERTKRILTYRNEALKEELKYSHSINDQELAAKVSERIQKLQEKAVAISIDPKRNIKNEILGYGIVMPSRTEVIKDSLGDESVYRLFSAVSHGQLWAIIQSSFRKNSSDIYIFENVKGGVLEKNISPLSLIYLCFFSIEYVTKAEIEQFKLFGWDERPLMQLDLEIKMNLEQISQAYKIELDQY